MKTCKSVKPFPKLKMELKLNWKVKMEKVRIQSRKMAKNDKNSL